MIDTRHSRHGIWRPFLGLVALTVLLGTGGYASECGVSPSLGLEVPFLSGDMHWSQLVPIDLGGDGATDFIFGGSGLLLGAHPLDEVWDGHTIHVIARESASGWRHLQSFSFDWVVAWAYTGDLDGDRLDDLVVLTARYPRLKLHLLRQTPSGRLSRSAGFVIPSGVDLERICIADAGHAKVLLHVSWRDEVTGDTAWGGILLEWHEESGFTLLWHEEFPFEIRSWRHPDVIGLVSTLTNPIATGKYYDPDTGQQRVLAIPVLDNGWGEPYQLQVSQSDIEDMQIVRHKGRNQLWHWSRQSPDTLRILAAERDDDSLTVKRIPIHELSEAGIRLRDTFHAWSTGSVVYLCRRGEGDNTNHQYALITVDTQTEWAAVASVWKGPSSLPLILAVGPNGMVEIIWFCGDAWILKPPKEMQTLQPDLPLYISRLLVSGDFDGDGLVDLLVRAQPESQPRASYVLMGLDRHPWFREPILVGATESLDSIGSGDVDGDGQLDLVFRFVDPLLEQLYYVPYFWNGWRYIRNDDARIYEPRTDQSIPSVRIDLVDYDGDGRDELFHWNRHCILAWEEDRRPQQGPVYLPLPFDSEFEAVADLNGDDRAEVASSRFDRLLFSSIDPTDGTWQRVNDWKAPQSIRDIQVVNLDADPEPELLVRYRHGSTILDFGRSIGNPQSIRDGPNTVLDSYTCLSNDVNHDGCPELVQTSHSVIEISFPAPEGWVVRHLVTPELVSGYYMASGTFAVWSDVDRDGDLDLVVLYENGVRVRLNDQVDRPEVSQGNPLIRVLSENPGQSSVRLAIRPAESGMVSVGLFDISGRRVWSSTQHALGGRWFNVLLDLDSGGRSLASGVYFVRAEGGKNAATRRIVLAH